MTSRVQWTHIAHLPGGSREQVEGLLCAGATRHLIKYLPGSGRWMLCAEDPEAALIASLAGLGVHLKENSTMYPAAASIAASLEDPC